MGQRRARPETIVKRAMDILGLDSAAEFGRRIHPKIKRQRVNGWLMRGQFPPWIAPRAHELTGIPLEELLDAHQGHGSMPDSEDDEEPAVASRWRPPDTHMAAAA